MEKVTYTTPAIVRRVFVRPTDRKALYIVWDEVQAEFTGWNYAGGGVTEVVTREESVTRRARYSSTATSQDILYALVYIRSNRPDAWLRYGEQ